MLLKYLKEILLFGILFCLIIFITKYQPNIEIPRPYSNVNIDNGKFIQIAPYTLGLYDDSRGELIIIQLDEDFGGYSLKGELEYVEILNDPSLIDKPGLRKIE